ncbi:MAG: tRNA (adenosine(37)-N6)-threonylcarbamoyltransferase complex ATPase subunit type 1 TsaE [Lachnospiraceae bacterium]|nr:tRNA (adenosine(37)-N6)-threonylcarbamoyltransferase complex ATPase subunit type 1 TsaE [Lachnospiraceae bacterium]
MTRVVESFGEEDTVKFADELAQKAQKGDIYALIGDLGAGKTAFAKGFAKGLGVKEPVVSPTFTILQIYESGRMPLYHFDVYRIGDISEMDEIGYEDCFFGDGVSLMEWADLVEPILPENVRTIRITCDITKGADYRKIEYEDNSH